MIEGIADHAETKKKSNRPHGTGSIWQPKGSTIWHIQYFRNGRRYRESAHTDNKTRANLLLKKRQAEITTGNFVGPKGERVLVNELAEDLLMKFRTGEIKGQRSLEWAERRWRKHVKPFFGELRAAQVGSDLISRYIQERQSKGASNASINRELAFLKRAFNVAMRAKPPKVHRVPAFPTLQENNVRKGFLADDQYDKLAAECAKQGLWMRALLAVACNFGWRKSELLNLKVSQIDLFARVIRLEVGETKNSEGRTVKMTDEAYTLLAACIQGKQPNDYVFTRNDGQPVRDFRQTWRNACTRAGVPALLFHDLRRTGARNLRRLGVGETTIMRIGGWKTRSVFDRYNIVDESDLADAAEKLNQKHRERMVSKQIAPKQPQSTVMEPVAKESALN